MPDVTSTVEPWSYIGYLHDQGLQFGWGPTSLIQWGFEHLQVYTGTSVGATIIAGAVIIRLLVFPLVVRASDTSARLKALNPQLVPLTDKMRQAMARQDKEEAARLRHEMSMIRKRNDIKFGRMAWPLVQVPLGFGSWRLLSNMAALPVPGMATGGLLWFQNLVVPDPFFVLPLGVGLAQHMSARVCARCEPTDRVALADQA